MVEEVHLPEWRNWQTRQVEGLVAFGSCRFKSCLRHLTAKGLRENRPESFLLFLAWLCHLFATLHGLAGALQGSASLATDRALFWLSEVTKMATLQSINNVYYVRFRFNGRPYRHGKRTSSA